MTQASNDFLSLGTEQVAPMHRSFRPVHAGSGPPQRSSGSSWTIRLAAPSSRSCPSTAYQVCGEPFLSIYGQGTNLVPAPQSREVVGLGQKERPSRRICLAL